MEKKEFQGKSVQEALQKACVYFDVDESGLLYTVLNESSRGFLGFKSKDARIEAEVLPKKLSIEEDIVRFLSPLFEQMALSPTIRVRQEENNVFVDIDGDDVGILIGHHGETMYAIQYLLSLAINKKQDTYYKIVLDISSYRSKRKEALEVLARNKANICRQRGRYVFEPMSAGERRIIHMALEHEADIETHSEGKEPMRRIVLVHKRKA